MARMEDWQGDLGRRWAEQAETQDRTLGAFEGPLLDALGPVAGRRALDLGCGQGATALALAARGAEVVGVDVSADLLRIAEARRAAAGETRATFLLRDAATAAFDAPFDALCSRFGAMFFDDPGPAWRNLRGAMKPGARLAVAAWRSIKENDWAGLPLRLCADLLPSPPKQPRGAPGPFGWADPDFFAPVLRDAGWRDVAWEEVDRDLAVETGDAADPVARAIDYVALIGPAASRLREVDDAAAAQVRARLEEGLAPHVRDGAVRLRGAVWIVTATA